jgi:hypothetical protein
MTGYEVDPERINSAGGGITTSAQQLRADWKAFEGQLASFGEPWGGDDVGFLIGGCYQAIYEVAAECYAENVDEMEAHGENVKTVAANHQSGEQANLVEVNRVRDILG